MKLATLGVVLFLSLAAHGAVATADDATTARTLSIVAICLAGAAILLLLVAAIVWWNRSSKSYDRVDDESADAFVGKQVTITSEQAMSAI